MASEMRFSEDRTMEKDIKVNKKVQYAVRMLLWHSDLAKRYMEYIKKWLDSKHLDYDMDLLQFLKTKDEKKNNSNQTTIFDFLGDEDY